MSAYTLETVLRYAYFHGFTSTQWAQPTKECIETADLDLTQDLCELLLKHLFANTRVHNILLESYVTFALTGDAQQSAIQDNNGMLGNKQFLTALVQLDDHYVTGTDHTQQWAYLLRLLPGLLADMDADRTDIPIWAPIVSRLLVMLAHIVAAGLYPHRQRKKKPEPTATQSNQKPMGMDLDDDDDMDSSQLLHFSLTNNTTQNLALDSQMTNASQSFLFDHDATFDMDNLADATQPDALQDDLFKVETTAAAAAMTTATGAGLPSTPAHPSTDALDADQPSANDVHAPTSQASSFYPGSLAEDPSMDSTSLTWSNAVAATLLLIDLIEKKGAKRIIDKYHQLQDKTESTEPWMTCHDILSPDQQRPVMSSHNVSIQKLHLLIERLTDRDLERRLAVHMKYHELEDEGTARAMPSAGLMAMLYHIVQLRPSLDDDDLVNRLIKLQSIKGSFDESFYLELWFAALTGLREASLSTSCQQQSSGQHDTEHQEQESSCNTTVATNRLLWKCLVLVKLPTLISKLQERKQKEDLAHIQFKRDRANPTQNPDGLNAMESSLMELRTFTGLLHACSPPACCAEFYVPSSKSSDLVDRFTFGQGKVDDEDDMMMMINEDNYTIQDSNTPNLNSPTFIKTIRSISDDDIFTSIVQSCLAEGLVRQSRVETLMANHQPYRKQQDEPKKETDTTTEAKDEFASLLDTDMLDVDDTDQRSNTSEKSSALAIVDQNIEQRISSLQENVTKGSISELIHVAFVSLTHWRKVADFLLEFLQEKARMGDIRSLSHICSALTECPAAIDLMLELYCPQTILGPLEPICNNWTPTQDYVDLGDSDQQDDDMDGMQPWYYKFGQVWTFVLVVASKFEIAPKINAIFKDKQGLCYRFFVYGPTISSNKYPDEQIEPVVTQWLKAMSGDGISDDLLRTTQLQLLIRAVPTMVHRLIVVYDAGGMELETLTGILSYFKRRFLQFTLMPCVIKVLCDELFSRAATAITCLTCLYTNPKLPDVCIALSANMVLGSLRAWKEQQRQWMQLHRPTSADTLQHLQQLQQQVIDLDHLLVSTLDLDDDDHLSFPETISSGVTRRNLVDKTHKMLLYIVKSGRSMYMNDVDGDAKILWDQDDNKKQVVAHYLDMVMFQTALKMGGTHWFVNMMVDTVLESGKSGGAVRAAELGSALVTMPLMYYVQGGSACLTLLRSLLQDVVPATINRHAPKNMSFFQGQTLGVFVGDCLALMYERHGDAVDKLATQFFDALVIDRVRGGQVSSLQLVPTCDADGSRFAVWNDQVVTTPLWRGFVKGVMSNPYIKEFWPAAYSN
ncbi:hypothetical protein DM01DRAFT_1409206 [Hesseltinella vesiculosa]|uniref:Mediator of RNA polymerase II transcription subunit 5 n=1 Tax=Hesseltinella vesiculosa TaxID=101127 RepID=A0A1X2GBX7_9FUNG|nr:hypothetical protein DM01DRAFT_1409206 [Hesseltinella vesiculosa]